MELKWERTKNLPNIVAVLIVPLWNWNTLTTWQRGRGRGVLIVPLWNWNRGIYRGRDAGAEGSNCTFMELKSACAAFLLPRHRCSNCTFMELKLLINFIIDLIYWVLIVPLWNWNCRDVYYVVRSAVLIVPLWNWNRAVHLLERKGVPF